MPAMLRTALTFCVLLLTLTAQAADNPRRDFAAIVASGELRMGVALFAPWTLRNAKGELTGSEIDVGRRLAADMNLKPVFTLLEWDKIIPALQKGDIDVIVAGMAITPARALQVNFSRPYAESGVSLASNVKLTEKFDSLDDLNQPDVAIGVVKDTAAEDYARRRFNRASIKTFPTQEQVNDALKRGLVHAYAGSMPTPRFLALANPGLIDAPLGSRALLPYHEAFAVRKGDPDFVNFLDAWVLARSADRWLDSVRNFWFDSLDWQNAAGGKAKQ
ncbi:MAG: transporter substrate-binding domain-containing protein [Spongiibacteraceae bacterium]|nr:transporter substrate-binding domain-containing protein [Spongiibacteraceae bacterium]